MKEFVTQPALGHDDDAGLVSLDLIGVGDTVTTTSGATAISYGCSLHFGLNENG